jgi:hypothetical protein
VGRAPEARVAGCFQDANTLSAAPKESLARPKCYRMFGYMPPSDERFAIPAVKEEVTMDAAPSFAAAAG